MRTLPPADVYVAAVGDVPGVEILLLPVAAPADARLADVVERRPDEIADDVRVVEHCRPVVERFEREGLCADHDPAGHARVVGLVTIFHVVVPRNVERCEVRVFVFAHVVNGGGDGARRVESAHVVRERLRHFHHFGTGAVRNLISDAPHDDGRVVAVALDHALDISLPPLVEI